MDTAWIAYLAAAVGGFAGLEIFAKVKGTPTLTQFLRRKFGVQPMHWLIYLTAPAVGAALVWLWVHLFTRWL